ncbi:ATP-binding protein [Pseudonocardia humida]|uniref:ATP-binding protein n=1 Tax=Pseudonocardia humida TaxID=2800819 RepID=A0ABT1A5X6_9PSEU|nr:ATP-binding protein [Pseudonocardia humida]MCO1658427.1 ATP-binding protein [Pseudonocardia humida]
MDRAVAQGQPGGGGVDPRSVAPGSHVAGGGATDPDERPDGLELRIPASVDRLRPLRRRIEAWALVRDLSDVELADLQLALGEAVSNSMEHAYRETEAGTVDIELDVRSTDAGRGVVVRVVDRGRWKPATSRPSHRGRGLRMIEGLSVDMRVTSNDSGTEVVFTVLLGG